MHRDGGDAKNCAAHTHGGAQKYSNLIHFTELHYICINDENPKKLLNLASIYLKEDTFWSSGRLLQFLEQSNLDVTAQGS